MGAHSVTGTGQGSAEGGLRAFNSLDWIRKVFGIDATQISDGTISNIQWSYLRGLDSNVQDQINAIAGAVAPNHVIFVDPNGEFQSIAAACDSITTSSESNRYVIKVSPGIYEEPLITIPSYVFVISEHIDDAVIKPDGNHHVFQLSNRSGIVNLTISNAPSGYASVYSHDVGNFALLHKVSIKDCDIGVLHESDAEDSYLFLEYVDFTDCNTVIKVTNLGNKIASLSSENLYFEYSSSNSANAVIVDGDNATFFGAVGNCVGADTTGNAFLVTHGAKLLLNSSRIVAFDRGVYAPNDGDTPYIKLSDIGFGLDNPNNINLEIANTTASGYLQGYSEHNKTIINKSNSFFVANKDERTIIVAKKGGDYNSVKDAVNSITDSSYDI